jgi:hypothetical protein
MGNNYRTGGSGFRLRQVTGTCEDWQAWIFREGRIGLRELAEEELGALAGIDQPGVTAIGAETKSRIFVGG